MTLNVPSVIAPQTLANALQRGIHEVLATQEHLNRINVFPVADGDTGTNLALTLASALSALRSGSDSVADLLARTADALLDGARGNSGAIIAQFFQGLADNAEALESLDTQSYTDAAAGAAKYARDAIAEPREGTILSVISAYAAALREGLSRQRDVAFETLHSAAVKACEEALKRTPDQLSVLKKAGVVDAGAQGFYTLIRGISAYLKDGVVPTELPAIAAEMDQPIDTLGQDADLEFRFCTECMVSGENIDRRKLRETLSQLGGSLVLAGSTRKAKIHIHVNEPDRVFRAAAEFGQLSGEKADDMHRQSGATHAIRGNVAVITDTAADMPEDVMDRLNIHTVPLRVNFGDRGYLDKVSISADEFFEKLSTSEIHPQTSQPAPGDYRRQFQYVASHYPEVIAPTLTGTVSGTLNAAKSAADRIAADRIRVVDTRNASVGQGLLTVYAAELAAAGHSASDIQKSLEQAIPHTRTFALLRTLDAAVRGGRVPAYAKWIAEVLHLNPVLGTTPDGQIKPVSALLGRKQRLKKFTAFIQRRAEKSTTYRVSISHAQCVDEAHALGAALSAAIGVPGNYDCSELGAAIGVHGGAGTLVAAIMPEPAASVTDG